MHSFGFVYYTSRVRKETREKEKKKGIFIDMAFYKVKKEASKTWGVKT